MSKAERKAASDAARASVELEGFVIPEDTSAQAQKYIEGDINIQELISLFYKKTKRSREIID
ncbi:antitoxin VbhA family protein [Alcaligenes sp. SORT26]|uniref:antitoxin VbhA family protein n=1 Tax=Alcaligenes sp. SORT26 TaxID=2813780 RepID=UPI001A9F92E2|nr:antitoxin VbhA family protein [Alcaligenes sp. SORT26]QTB99414.1 antitoxin VbhA family protein [Alcaligenes sp. SORT26]